MFQFQDFVRKQADFQPLQSVDPTDLIAQLKAVTIRMVENKEGDRFLHFVNNDDDYISTRLGKRVVLTTSGDNAVKELVNNYILYYGVSDAGNKWLTWGPAPTNGEPLVEMSIADLLKSVKPMSAKI